MKNKFKIIYDNCSFTLGDNIQGSHSCHYQQLFRCPCPTLLLYRSQHWWIQSHLVDRVCQYAVPGFACHEDNTAIKSKCSWRPSHPNITTFLLWQSYLQQEEVLECCWFLIRSIFRILLEETKGVQYIRHPLPASTPHLHFPLPSPRFGPIPVNYLSIGFNLTTRKPHEGIPQMHSSSAPHTEPHHLLVLVPSIPRPPTRDEIAFVMLMHADSSSLFPPW